MLPDANNSVTHGAAESLPPVIKPFGGERFFCPVALPQFRFQRGDYPMSRIRQLAYRSREKGAARRLLRTARHRLTWPRLAARIAARACAIWGNAAVAQGGVPTEVQRAQLIAEAVGNNIGFVGYYAFQLWRQERLAQADLYLQDFECNWINDLLAHGQDRNQLDDKLRFADFCERHGLNTVPIVLGLMEDESEHWRSSRRQLPETDLFVKSMNLWAGLRTERWKYDSQSARWQRAEHSLDQPALLARWRKLSADGALIVQPRAHSHPSHAALNPDAVGTLRCVTYRLSGQASKLYRASQRFPRAGMITDHGSSGAVAAAVESDGTLREAESRTIGPSYTHHPDWQVAISGRLLPGYHDMIELARHAHDAAAFTGIIGWDMAMTESGATLIEANTNSGLEFIQTTWNEPLGATEYPDFALALLSDRGLL